MKRLATAALFAVLAIAPAARAGGNDPASAEALFLAGREAVDRHDYASARPKFAESERLDPAPGTLINLADCEEHVGQPAHAWGHWKEAADLLAANDPRLPIIKQRAKDVEKRVPRLTLKLAPDAPADAKISRDDAEVGRGSLNVALPEEPGLHVFVVTAPGHQSRRFTVTMAEGESAELVVDAGAIDVVPVAPPVVAPPVVTPAPLPREVPASGNGSRTLGYVLGGVGVASVGLGAVTGILAIGKKSELAKDCYPAKVCTPDGADAASAGRTFATVSTIAFAVGVAALGAGVYFVLSSPRKASTTTAIAPLALPGGGGLSLSRTFQ